MCVPQSVVMGQPLAVCKFHLHVVGHTIAMIESDPQQWLVIRDMTV